MENSRVLESSDSLWFFSNIVLSSTTQFLSSDSNEVTTLKHVKLPVKEESSKPASEIFQNQQNKSSNNKITSASRCPKCREFAATECEPKLLNLVDMEVMEKINRRKVKSLKSRRNIIGEFDLCFIMKEVYADSWMYYEKNCGYNQRFGHNDEYKNVFPLNDNAAMKENLKSWAYVVASTVR